MKMKIFAIAAIIAIGCGQLRADAVDELNSKTYGLVYAALREDTPKVKEILLAKGKDISKEDFRRVRTLMIGAEMVAEAQNKKARFDKLREIHDLIEQKEHELGMR